MNIQQIKEMLLQYYDADDLVDVLGIEAEELLDRFEDKLDKFDTNNLPEVELPYNEEDHY